MEIHITTFGTSIRVNDGLLSIKKEDKIERLPIGKIRKIFITKSIHLSSDVLVACIENGVDLIIVERSGQPIGRIWNNVFGSISLIRKKQLAFSNSIHVTSWICMQIQKKAAHQEELLYCLLSLDYANPPLIHQSIASIKNNSERLKNYENEIKDDVAASIRAIEGQIARTYFKCVNEHLPFLFQFEKRSKHPAKDMTNAMMNYAYGILYGHIESALIKSGLDPYIGFFHRDDYNKPVLTYDIIEVFRPWADWVVFHLCMNEVLDQRMFIEENGGMWAGADAKRILIQHFTDFFDEVVPYENHRYSRFTHIDRLATKLATTIQNFEI